MTTPAGESASALSGILGRYFVLVSLLPSVGLTAWISFLVASGAWTGEPNWSRASISLSGISVGGVLLLVAVSIVLAAALHPLQFLLVQALEGYWGAGELAARARAARIAVHSSRRAALNAARLKARPAADPDLDHPDLVALSIYGEATRELAQYPGRVRRVMPTRLRNMLRKHEDEAGSQYGLSAVQLTGHLMQVAKSEDVRYVNDQRVAVDVAVRWCLVALVGAAAAVLLLWQHGAWLLLAVPPYAVAYLGYRGSVVAARHYGRALAMLVDLNRFALYERLRLPMPRDTVAERNLAERLDHLLNKHSKVETVTYVLTPPHTSVEAPRIAPGR